MSVSVGVVIGTRGNPELVVAAVDSILAGTVVPDELVVVDQTRPVDPGVRALAEAHEQVRVIDSTSVGLSSARNEGIAATTSDVVAFTDDDVFVDPRWLEEMLAGLERAGPRAAVTGRVVAGPPEVPGGTALSLATGTEPAVYEGLIRRDPLSGNSLAARRQAFDECGLFDERLGPGAPYASADDNDFGYRLLRAGYSIHFLPAAVVVHRAWRAGGSLRKVQRDYGRGQGAFIAKHALSGDAWMRGRFRSATRWWLVRMLRRPLRERGLRGHGELTYLLAFLHAILDWWVHEHRRKRRG
ncbi:MAG: hypothetical protein QOH73_1033 [Gaiellaceae bacterium]|nr:hypothetical protein [Gaiellaceae bacterium]